MIAVLDLFALLGGIAREHVQPRLREYDKNDQQYHDACEFEIHGHFLPDMPQGGDGRAEGDLLFPLVLVAATAAVARLQAGFEDFAASGMDFSSVEVRRNLKLRVSLFHRYYIK